MKTYALEDNFNTDGRWPGAIGCSSLSHGNDSSGRREGNEEGREVLNVRVLYASRLKGEWKEIRRSAWRLDQEGG